MNKPGEIGAELLMDLRDHVADVLTNKVELPDGVAKGIAQDVAVRIADNWGGQVLYIPMDLATKMNTRNAEIMDAFTGDNINGLVKQFRLSRQTIYRILKAERERRAPKQGSLFQHLK
jgi:Mor family transcriptional regulator